MKSLSIICFKGTWSIWS